MMTKMIRIPKVTKRQRDSARTLDQNLSNHARELAEKMQKIHEQQRAAIILRHKKRMKR